MYLPSAAVSVSGGQSLLNQKQEDYMFIRVLFPANERRLVTGFTMYILCLGSILRPR